jgi:hypothetical protein
MERFLAGRGGRILPPSAGEERDSAERTMGVVSMVMTTMPRMMMSAS